LFKNDLRMLFRSQGEEDKESKMGFICKTAWDSQAATVLSAFTSWLKVSRGG